MEIILWIKTRERKLKIITICWSEEEWGLSKLIILLEKERQWKSCGENHTFEKISIKTFSNLIIIIFVKIKN